MLRPDGLGSVDFGTPADVAVVELTRLLGPPDRDRAVDPDRECVEGSDWSDCVPVVDQGRIVTWGTWGLDVLLTDDGGWDGTEPRTVPPHLGSWQATSTGAGRSLTTIDGIRAGMTAGQLRRSGSRIEFHINEGVMDSFTVDDRSGTYLGRLGWDDENGYWAGLQRTLNQHGAELVVDGIAGPATQRACDELATASGLEPTEGTGCWMTPELAELLGFPPDEFTIATLTAPVFTTAPSATSPADLQLRPDGFGEVDLGDPTDQLTTRLEATYGPPTDQTVITAEPPGPFPYLPGGYHAAYEIRFLEWAEPGLSLVVSDTPFRGDHWDPPVPGTLTLVSWQTTSEEFRLVNGLGVGSTLAELGTAYPALVVGSMDLQCEMEYLPAMFLAPTPTGTLRGSLDWDWVSEVQAALNARGATLVIDGEYGPSTSAAVAAFQQENAIEASSEDANGQIGPQTMVALGLTAPNDARVAVLAAGYPGSC